MGTQGSGEILRGRGGEGEITANLIMAADLVFLGNESCLSKSSEDKA